jgi:predicted RNA-binding Zn-ribbon protein involved in translation (DUF1610 family)
MSPEETRSGTVCPECGSANIRRSHRKGAIEKFVSERMRRDPYRCEACLARFFKYREGDPAERVYREPSYAPQPVVAFAANHGRQLQRKRRLALFWIMGLSTLLGVFFLVAYAAGGKEPSPLMMRITRMFGSPPSTPARRRR